MATSNHQGVSTTLTDAIIVGQTLDHDRPRAGLRQRPASCLRWTSAMPLASLPLNLPGLNGVVI